MSEAKVTKLALASRLIVLALQLLSNALLPDHQPDVFRAPVTVAYTGWQQSVPADINNNNSNLTSTFPNTFMDAAVNFCLGGLRHWDGEYFLHIAEHSYSYENTLAFYPLYPLLVRTGARILHYMTLGMGLGLSLRSCSLLVAVALNLYCFCKAANALYALTQHIFGDLHKSWNAALLFCFNPAAIFFSAAYSEALFCCLSLHLMLECVGEMRLLRMTTALALSIVSRSNGLVNAGFPLYFCARKLLLPTQKHFYSFFKLIICLCGSLLPLTVFYFYAFQQFCLPQLESSKDLIAHEPAVAHYAQARNYVLAGQRQPHNSPWCDLTFPFPYSYIQSHYWHVGFLRYYEFKQLPNFLLAAPILGFLLLHCYKYLRHFMRSLLPKYPLRQLLDEYKSLPFVVHSLVLALFCTFFVHIQISTRLLCSSTPCLYWFAADHLPKTFDQIKLRSKAGLILAWFGSYFVLGTALFSNNLPWT